MQTWVSSRCTSLLITRDRRQPQFTSISQMEFSLRSTLRCITRGFTVFKYLQWHCQHLLQLSCRALSDFLPFDEGKLLKELNDNFSVRRELEMAANQLNLKYREYMAIASAALITAKNINLDQAVVEEPDTFVWKQTEWLSSLAVVKRAAGWEAWTLFR